MTHSFLIVGGTKKKRRFRATQNNSERRKVSTSERQSIGDVGVPEFRIFRRSGSPRHRRTDAPSRSEFSDSLKFDTTILEPEEDKRTISIDQIRDLQHQLSLKPYAAKCKTGIILEAQRLTIEAQNALLKTLEEPPAHSVLILTAPSTKNLLPTIVSRCQIVRLRPEIDLDVESEEHQQAAAEFLQLLRSGRGERLEWVEENKSALSSQLLALSTLDVWISVLRDLLLINSSCQSLILNSFKPFRPFKPQILTEALEKAIETKNLIAKTNVSPRLALEVLLLDLPTLQLA